jgi:geranylgeranyl reductase family protein
LGGSGRHFRYRQDLSSLEQFDVVVAGAGPAGVAAAVALRRADASLRVLALDRARFPRAKPCGGGLTGHAEAAMRALGLELAVPSEAAGRARVTFGELGRDVTLAKPVRVVRREEFDASLVAQARDVGVEVREAAPLEAFEVAHDGVGLRAGGRAYKARVLVGADGVGSQVRKHLHANERGVPIRLFRAELPARTPWPRDLMLYDFSPMADGLRGYLWIFPAPGDRLNVGLMHSPTVALSGAELTTMLAAHLRRFDVTLESEARGWPAWGYSPSARVSGERLLLAGDAAGIDALTGEGIAVGLEEGPVVAAAILDAFQSGDFSFAAYRRALRKATVGRELAIDRWLAWLLYGTRSWRRWLAFVLGDEKMLDLYASRVCGAVVLADRKRELLAAMGRWISRRPTLASAAPSCPTTPTASAPPH